MAAQRRNSAADPTVTCDGPGRVGMTGAERQARYRQRHRGLGLVSVTVLVPAGSAADLQVLAEGMRAYPHLRPGLLRDPDSGKLVSLKLAAGARRHQ